MILGHGKLGPFCDLYSLRLKLEDANFSSRTWEPNGAIPWHIYFPAASPKNA
jgi:hypothetical protein